MEGEGEGGKGLIFLFPKIYLFERKEKVSLNTSPPGSHLEGKLVSTQVDTFSPLACEKRAKNCVASVNGRK